ncbi:MAG TPA: pyridoxine 5'-phosphate synthase [Vicinamibacterales bacterium]|nr:pyridoxine 5'-phosphate synthase [Vicinamibacterales bacterium]
MICLSVNVNKIATLRNSRGGHFPRVTDAVAVCLNAGVHGITVHPRGDRRHITPDDVYDVKKILAVHKPHVEFNIEGDPRPDFLELVEAVRPDQCTLVPVAPGEITSQAGWQPGPQTAAVADVVSMLKARGIRVSLFVDPQEAPIRWAASTGAERIELYTEPFARAYERGVDAARESFRAYADAARLAHSLGLGINAGHDLDLDNLTIFRQLPHLAEVSIGHAIVSRAVFAGLEAVVREYLAVLADA